METGRPGQQPIIGTRQIQTVIRLRDGETNMLAGLIQRENQDTVSGVPGLSDIPGLRRVLRQDDDPGVPRDDIIMTLTPRIIRIPDITEDDLATLWVGTEDNMRLRGPARNALHARALRLERSTARWPDRRRRSRATTGFGPSVRRRGARSRISPSEEVERDRAAGRERTGRRPAAAAAEADRGSGSRSTGGAVGPAPGDGAEDEPGESDDRPRRTTIGPRGDDDHLTGPAMVRLVPSKLVLRR